MSSFSTRPPAPARSPRCRRSRGDEARAFLEGVRRGASDPAAIATIVHGTTVGTNALLQRQGAATGLITTAGFRDVLEMRRRDRPQTWGLWGQFTPVVPRDFRLEVAERTLADGTIRTAVDTAEVEAAARQLLAQGAAALAIVFVNSYANAENERRALDVVRALWPNDYVNASSEILPEIREFERSSTTVLNAYLQPVVARYLDRLEEGLRQSGSAAQILIVQSNGGVMTVERAKRLPIRTALSGPAAGVIAGAHIAASAGFPNVITCDMGGTSFDVSLIAGGKTALAAQTSIDFGLVVRAPMIEITTIGAGGGSLAALDRGGLLQIGPESAGADPGPACYGLGNDRPTVTDAHVLLGRIDAERPIGGRTALDIAAAERAIASHVAKPLGLAVTAAAEAIIRVANSRMAGAIRLVSIERGHDPRDFVAMPFGGGGALHAGALIKEVGLAKALVPRFPGVTSALGCVIADMRHDFVLTLNRMVEALDIATLRQEMRRMASEGLRLLERSGVPFTAREVLVEFDMSYVGQTHTVAVPVAVGFEDGGDEPRCRGDPRAPSIRATAPSMAGCSKASANACSIFGSRWWDAGRNSISCCWRPAPGGSIEVARRGTRRVYADGGWVETPVYERLDLPPLVRNSWARGARAAGRHDLHRSRLARCGRSFRQFGDEPEGLKRFLGRPRVS